MVLRSPLLALALVAAVAAPARGQIPIDGPPAGLPAPFRAFPATSYWNTPLPADAPVHKRSKRMIRFLVKDNRANHIRLAGTDSDGAWGQPVYWADALAPAYRVRKTRYDLPPEFSSLRIPLGARPDPTSDSEMTIYDLERGYVAGLYEARFDASRGTWSAGGGDIYYLGSNGLHGDLKASDDDRNRGHRGLPASTFAVRLDEILAGTIDHVLKIGVHHTRSQHVFPMVGDEDGTDAKYAPPEGTRIRIKPSVNVEALGLPLPALVIARALQRYGAIIGDQTGGDPILKVENVVAEGRGNLWSGLLDAGALSSIPLGAYQVIRAGYRP